MSAVLYVNLSYENYKNKTVGQLHAFYELGFVPYLITIRMDVSKVVEVFEYNGDVLELISTFHFSFKGIRQEMKVLEKEVIKLIEKNKFEIIYVRRPGIRNIFLKRLFKRISKNSKLIYEIPTYPLDKEYKLKWKVIRQIEMSYFNLFLKRYIDIIPIMLQKKMKLDSKMICVNNGVNLRKFETIGNVNRKLENTLKMISIAHLNNWHGLDRLINSIYNYKGKYTFKLYIVSESTPEQIYLKNKVESFDIVDNVKFLGPADLTELKEIIDNCHVGVGSLGYHRRGADFDTSIKNKEYCAMALPFILSAYDHMFNKDFEYMYKVSSDDYQLDLDAIFDWYSNIEKIGYVNEMKKYASENLNYKKQMEVMLREIEILKKVIIE